jgi:trans-aconitate methyltransferase
MENADGVLVPYLERLGENAELFMQAYRERLRQHMAGSHVFYSFHRAIFVGTKG